MIWLIISGMVFIYAVVFALLYSMFDISSHEEKMMVDFSNGTIGARQWEVLKERVRWLGTEQEFVETLKARIRELKDERNRLNREKHGVL